jgi:hypothetical protein
MAVPFVQGQLRDEVVSVVIVTSCNHCGREMRIAVDSNMKISILSGGTKPMVFMPDVDWSGFSEHTIIDAY